MQQVALLYMEVSTLHRANEALSKRWKAKKRQIQHGGTLTAQDVEDILEQKDVDEQVVQEIQQNSGQTKGGRTKSRSCGVCGKPEQYDTLCCLPR